MGSKSELTGSPQSEDEEAQRVRAIDRESSHSRWGSTERVKGHSGWDASVTVKGQRRLVTQ